MSFDRVFPLSNRTSNLPRAPRRPNHGSTAAFSVGNPLLQPQDGAIVATMSEKVSPINGRMSLVGGEPDDARLTGATRSLFRRVMGLNVSTLIEKARVPAKARTPQKAMPAAVEVVSTIEQQQVA
jgi:hypothetical protein